MGEHVVVLSRAGSASIPPDLTRQVRGRARVDFVVRQTAPDPHDAADLLRDATVLATTNLTLPRLDDELLDRLPRLRVIVLYATGYEHVDLELLARHGVTLSVLPAYATGAVAEHALAMLLTLAARTHLANDKARGLVARDTSLRGVELGGRTLGVVGVGRIGFHLSRIATGIGMTVLGSDPDPSARAAAREVGLEMTTTDDLLERSSAVALCASTDRRRPVLLDADRLHLLPPGAFVVNVGRPGLVDTDAAVALLRSRHLRGYAVDDVVLDPVDHADLLAEGRVLQTSHSAWWRDEVLARGAEQFGLAVLAAVEGTPVDVAAVRPTHPTVTRQPAREQVA